VTSDWAGFAIALTGTEQVAVCSFSTRLPATSGMMASGREPQQFGDNYLLATVPGQRQVIFD
jgi:hypothetical protein